MSDAPPQRDSLSVVAGSSRSSRSIRRLIRAAALLVLVVGLFGLAGRLYLIESGLALIRRESPLNVFFRLYVLHEQPMLLLLIVFAALTWWYARQTSESHSSSTDRLETLASRISMTRVAAATFVVTAIGTLVVMHGVGLSMDEFAASFQARIFAAGRVTAAIPSEWQALAPWMTPTFVTYKPAAHAWIASYLPVYAAMRALLVPLHADWLLNPLLAAASVVLLDRVARRLWQDWGWVRLLALVFLVTSPQFLATSMSGYSMSAHLCLNLTWLLLYLRDDRVGYLTAPWVGVVAMGLHNPFPHALFVVPFLVRILTRRRFGWLAYTSAMYLLGAVVWLQWLRFSTATGVVAMGASPASFLGGFRLPDASMLFVHGLDLSLLFSWQTPVLSVLLVVAMLAWRSLRRTERDLAAGLLLTFAFYLLFPHDQGHGWGYRYAYGALGNVVLLGAAGAALAVKHLRRERIRALIITSLLATVAIQLPLRLWQIERFVRPYADAMAFIAARPAPLVAVDYAEGSYAWDLIRNDPLFRDGPRITAYSPRRAPPPAVVPGAVRDSVYIFSRRDMARFGIPLFPPRP